MSRANGDERGPSSRRGVLKRAAVGLAVLATSVAGGSLATSNVALANGSCDASEFCAWSSPSYAGEVETWFGDSGDWPGPGVCGNCVENDEESVWNRSTNYMVRVYMYTGYGTNIYCTPRNSAYPSMGIANQGSSHVFVSATVC